jgi:ABC-type phosphate transport system permease subunit
MQLFCQWVVFGLLVLGLLVSVYGDFHGRTSRPPGGFSGFVGTLVITAILAAVYVTAGCFSLIFK